MAKTHKPVVTLFHFYCGLRQSYEEPFEFDFAVVTLFHFYCGLRLFCYYNRDEPVAL